jgi:SAM-dependent methyltransferase
MTNAININDDISPFLDYWETEGATYARAGDYAWMAAQAPEAKRVLEIGCGVGFGTLALLQRGFSVLAVDMLEACLAATRGRIANAGQAGEIAFLQADINQLDAAARQVIADFQPQIVLCWLMGAPREISGATSEKNQEASETVTAYRKKTHRQAAELAASLPDVIALHFVDRTALPWQAKDLGRKVLMRYHSQDTLADLPFDVARQDTLYRKLAGGAEEMAWLQRKIAHAQPALKSVVPVLGSLVARRRTT